MFFCLIIYFDKNFEAIVDNKLISDGNSYDVIFFIDILFSINHIELLLKSKIFSFKIS